jgi:tRNA threonylcarbamoyladenosine biosynthesis protein TsaB
VTNASSISHEFLQDKTEGNAGFTQVWQRNCPIIAHVLILALDTSSPSGSLAVLRDEAVLGAVGTNTDENFSSRLFRQLQFLLAELDLTLNQFDLFSVVAGPGSFTGLRVGLAAAKGWAEVQRKPIAAVSALEAVAAQSHVRVARVVAVLDARRGQRFFAVYRRTSSGELALEGDERLATPNELSEILSECRVSTDMVVATPAKALVSTMVRDLTEQSGSSHAFTIEEVSSILAPTAGRLGLLRAQSGRLTDSLSLDANYIRRSDAELHLKEPAGT